VSTAAIVLIALGLSADTFAVSLARGAAGKVAGAAGAVRMGLLFGASEAAMPFLGWLLASRFADQVSHLDHWLALLLLGAVGGHMIFEGATGAGIVEAGIVETGAPPARRGLLGNVLTALGTSVDAAAVGVALAFISVDIVTAVLVIGLVSFSASTLGMLIGPRVGRYLGRRAEIAGGLVLIGIGGFIFCSHMFGG
jgi:putative Mn2+ efflux pump MntP